MHADHVTGTGYLKALSGCKSIISKMSGAMADLFVDDNDYITFGSFKLKVLSTPGHTNGCCSYYCEEEVRKRCIFLIISVVQINYPNEFLKCPI